jgi:phosphocarrier protein HPr
MFEREIQITNSLGIHARPASKIVQTATRFKSEIRLVKQDWSEADAKSILNVMMLGADFGSTLVIRASGSDEQEAVEALASLFENKFFEE